MIERKAFANELVPVYLTRFQIEKAFKETLHLLGFIETPLMVLVFVEGRIESSKIPRDISWVPIFEYSQGKLQDPSVNFESLYVRGRGVCEGRTSDPIHKLRSITVLDGDYYGNNHYKKIRVSLGDSFTIVSAVHPDIFSKHEGFNTAFKEAIIETARAYRQDVPKEINGITRNSKYFLESKVQELFIFSEELKRKIFDLRGDITIQELLDSLENLHGGLDQFESDLNPNGLKDFSSDEVEKIRDVFTLYELL